MAGSTVTFGRAKFSFPSLTGESVIVLMREVPVDAIRELDLIVRVHTSPSMTNLAAAVKVWSIAPSADDPGTDYIFRADTAPYAPIDLASVALLNGVPAGSMYLAPVTAGTPAGHFGTHVRVVLVLTATGTATLTDLTISVELALKN